MPSLFDAIRSQTTAKDRKSLLALQRFVRLGPKKYSYLEIGSHLGGVFSRISSIPCAIVSIPLINGRLISPIIGARLYHYRENSTDGCSRFSARDRPGRQGDLFR